MATAVGFLRIVRNEVEATVLEVGLGGRLDSTNVCLPDLAVITSISHDHTRILGNRLEQIAREKAGIIKSGRPVVSGVVDPEARQVIEQVSRERHAPLLQMGRDFHFAYHPGRVGGARPRVDVTTAEHRWDGLELNLIGDHQAANAAVAVAGVEVLTRHGWRIPEEAVRDGLATVDWPARLEVVGTSPWVVLDCAHNVASAEALVRALQGSFPPCRRVLLFAGSGDKDLSGMLRVLGPHFAAAVFTRYVHNPRATPPDELAAVWRGVSTAPAEVRADPAAALARAREGTAPDDLLCITGSVFLAGEVRPLLVADPS
ncbi:MAG: Mur ligase family protein [Gemmataceae bacterium]